MTGTLRSRPHTRSPAVADRRRVDEVRDLFIIHRHFHVDFVNQIPQPGAEDDSRVGTAGPDFTNGCGRRFDFFV